MYDIEFANRQEYLEADEALLKEIAERTLLEEQVAEANLSIALVDNAAIRELNSRYLNHDFATDVLSFLLECSQSAAGGTAQAAAARGTGKRIEGQVVISAEMAAQRAAEFRWSPHDELALYLVHALLHLVGYDDQTVAEDAVMRARERTILKFWNLTPHDANSRPDDEAGEHFGSEEELSGVDT